MSDGLIYPPIDKEPPKKPAQVPPKQAGKRLGLWGMLALLFA